MSWNEIRQEINTNIADNEKQLITAQKVRTTLIDIVDETEAIENEIYDEIETVNDNFQHYYTKDEVDDIETSISNIITNMSEIMRTTKENTIRLTDNIVSLNDAIKVLAKKKYVGNYNGNIFISDDNSFYCPGFMYSVEEAKIEDEGGQPLNGLYVKCSLNLLSSSISLNTASGIFFKNRTNVYTKWYKILYKALELSGIDKNGYAIEYTKVFGNTISFINNNLIFLQFSTDFLNCFSTESIPDAMIETGVNIEFYLLQQY